MSETAVIYALWCKHKVYVGSAKQGKKRQREHFNALRKGRHENPYLQRAWDKYGEDQFSFSILETCDLILRWHREQYWIDKLCACDRKRGFNVMHSVQTLMPSQQMSEKLKAYWQARWQDEEYAKRRTEQLRNLSKQPGVHEKMSLSKIESWADPKYRELQVQKHKDYAAKNKDKMRQRTLTAWADPEYRAKQLAERKARFANPEFRKKLSLAASRRKPRAKWYTYNEIV